MPAQWATSIDAARKSCLREVETKCSVAQPPAGRKGDFFIFGSLTPAWHSGRAHHFGPGGGDAEPPRPRRSPAPAAYDSESSLLSISTAQLLRCPGVSPACACWAASVLVDVARKRRDLIIVAPAPHFAEICSESRALRPIEPPRS